MRLLLVADLFMPQKPIIRLALFPIPSPQRVFGMYNNYWKNGRPCYVNKRIIPCDVSLIVKSRGTMMESPQCSVLLIWHTINLTPMSLDYIHHPPSLRRMTTNRTLHQRNCSHRRGKVKTSKPCHDDGLHQPAESCIDATGPCMRT